MVQAYVAARSAPQSAKRLRSFWQSARLRGKKRALTESEVQCIMRQLLVSVHFMHGRGIVHFHLKPENFLLSQV